jgi:hypothetical protein
MLRDQTPTVALLSAYINSFGHSYLKKATKIILNGLANEKCCVEVC